MINAISVVMVRILAVYILYQALLPMTIVVLAAFSYGEAFQDLYGTLGLAFGLHIGLLMTGLAVWFLAPRIARRLRGDFEEPSEDKFGPEELVGAGTFLIGLFLVAYHLPDVVISGVLIAMLEDTGTGLISQSTTLARTVVFTVAGAAMMIGSNSVVRLFRWVRSA